MNTDKNTNIAPESITDWDITAVNLHRARQQQYQLAVIPIGAIEPHNRHLPLGQDFFHTTYVARRCTQTAAQSAPGIVCLPTIPFGVDCNLLDYPLTIHVSQAHIDAVLTDIVKSLRNHQIQKFVLVNGHGGNDFTPFIRQTQSDLDVFIFLADWWKIAHDKYDEIFTRPDDHAGQMETSVALHLHPQLVELQNAGPAAAAPFRFDALNKGYLRTSRNFAQLNDLCAVGNPADSSAEKGKKYLDITCQRLIQFLIELANSTLDENFPHTK